LCNELKEKNYVESFELSCIWRFGVFNRRSCTNEEWNTNLPQILQDIKNYQDDHLHHHLKVKDKATAYFEQMEEFKSFVESKSPAFLERQNQKQLKI